MSGVPSTHKASAPKNLGFAIIVCSSSRYKQLESGEAVDDPSGDLIVQLLHRHGHTVISRTTVSDDQSVIKQVITKTLASKELDVIITCGGTGISPTDVTIETVHAFLEKEIPGFGEVFRQLSYEQIGSAAIITRAIAGVSKGKAIFCIPVSPQAVALSLEKLIIPESGHIVLHARGK